MDEEIFADVLLASVVYISMYITNLRYILFYHIDGDSYARWSCNNIYCGLTSVRCFLFHVLSDYSATAGAPALHGHGDKFASHKLPVVSAKWVRDEGIVRLMKSFNAWERMKVKKNRNKDTGVGKESIHNKVLLLVVMTTYMQV